MRGLLKLIYLLKLEQDSLIRTCTAALCRSLLAARLCISVVLLCRSWGGYLRGLFFPFLFHRRWFYPGGCALAERAVAL